MKRNNHSNSNTTANSRNKVKTVKRSYNISSQTDYHIQRMAKIAGVSEGRIIDKVMRAYLINLDSSYDK